MKTYLEIADFHTQSEELTVIKSLLQVSKASNILLYGHPGTSKTSLATALAKELGFKLFSVKSKGEDARIMGFA